MSDLLEIWENLETNLAGFIYLLILNKLPKGNTIVILESTKSSVFRKSLPHEHQDPRLAELCQEHTHIREMTFHLLLRGLLLMPTATEQKKTYFSWLSGKVWYKS